MSEYNKEFIGKVYKDIKADTTIIVGFDYITNRYISRKIVTFGGKELMSTINCLNLINNDEDLDNYISFEEYMSNLEKAIDLDFEAIEIYNNISKSLQHKFIHHSYRQGFFNAIRRINYNYKNLTRLNIKLKTLISKTEIDRDEIEKCKKELKEVKKGYKRSLKILYRYVSGDNFYVFLEFLERNNYNFSNTYFFESLVSKRDYLKIFEVDYLEKLNAL